MLCSCTSASGIPSLLVKLREHVVVPDASNSATAPAPASPVAPAAPAPAQPPCSLPVAGSSHPVAAAPAHTHVHVDNPGRAYSLRHSSKEPPRVSKQETCPVEAPPGTHTGRALPPAPAGNSDDGASCTRTAGCTKLQGHRGFCVGHKAYHGRNRQDHQDGSHHNSPDDVSSDDCDAGEGGTTGAATCERTPGCTKPPGHKGFCVGHKALHGSKLDQHDQKSPDEASSDDSDSEEGTGGTATCTRTPGCTKPPGHRGFCTGHRAYTGAKRKQGDDNSSDEGAGCATKGPAASVGGLASNADPQPQCKRGKHSSGQDDSSNNRRHTRHQAAAAGSSGAGGKGSHTEQESNQGLQGSNPNKPPIPDFITKLTSVLASQYGHKGPLKGWTCEPFLAKDGRGADKLRWYPVFNHPAHPPCRSYAQVAAVLGL
jgi:hypothetical protein